MHQTHQETMPRFRSRSNFLRPVNRIKHVVDLQQGLAAAVNVRNFLIRADDNPVLANTADVETGSTVHGMYLKVEANATTSAALPNFYMIVYKSPGDNLTAIVPNTVGANDDKRYVIHQEMLMFQQQDGSNPRTIFNGVIKIPRGYQRFGPNDRLYVAYLAPGVTTNICHQAHFKEFR